MNLNVYSPTAYDDAIFMPIASNAFKFYTFNLEGLETINGLTIYKIRFAEAMEPEIGMRGSICHRPVMDDR